MNGEQTGIKCTKRSKDGTEIYEGAFLRGQYTGKGELKTPTLI